MHKRSRLALDLYDIVFWFLTVWLAYISLVRSQLVLTKITSDSKLSIYKCISRPVVLKSEVYYITWRLIVWVVHTNLDLGSTQHITTHFRVCFRVLNSWFLLLESTFLFRTETVVSLLFHVFHVYTPPLAWSEVLPVYIKFKVANMEVVGNTFRRFLLNSRNSRVLKNCHAATFTRLMSTGIFLKSTRFY